MSDLQRVLTVALEYKCRHENAYPDVGIGSFPNSIVDELLTECRIAKGLVDYKKLLATAEKFLR